MNRARVVTAAVCLALLGACSTFGGSDAGPTTGTLHVETTGIDPTEVAASWDAVALRADAYTQPPSTAETASCGMNPYIDVAGASGYLRAYLHIRANPPENGTFPLVPNLCAEYFAITRNAGLPSERRYEAQSGTVTITNASNAGFDFAVDATLALDSSSPSFHATVTASVHVIQGLAAQ